MRRTLPLVVLAAACHALPPIPPPFVVEAEGAIVRSWCASGGECVELVAGSGAIGIPPPPPGRTRLFARCSTSGAAGGALDLVAGATTRRVAIAPTLHRERYEWVELAELDGDRAAAPTKLAGGSADPVRVDQLAWLAPGGAPENDPLLAAQSPPVWRSADGRFELRPAAGAVVFDREWIEKLLREQADAVVALFGRKLARPLLLIPLPCREFAGSARGAFQNGPALFLRDDELHLPWRSYSHEVAHVLEDERGWRLPWWLSEGIAEAAALAVEARSYDLGPARRAEIAAIDALAVRGSESWRPEAGGADPLFALTKAPDERAARLAAYRFAASIVRAAIRRAGGDGALFFGRFAAAADRATAADPALAADGFELLEAAAGVGLAELRAAVGAAPSAAGR